MECNSKTTCYLCSLLQWNYQEILWLSQSYGQNPLIDNYPPYSIFSGHAESWCDYGRCKAMCWRERNEKWTRRDLVVKWQKNWSRGHQWHSKCNLKKENLSCSNECQYICCPAQNKEGRSKKFPQVCSCCLPVPGQPSPSCLLLQSICCNS